MKKGIQQAVQGGAGASHARPWAACLCLLAITHANASPTANPDALIQIGVEVVEVNEQKAQDLGIQWINALHVTEADMPSFFKVGKLVRSHLFADIQTLMAEGAADMLANPKLVARNGTAATFHAGGELPYATSAGLGTVAVEFKPYGVKLNIEPRLNEQGRIGMDVRAEVSSPDLQNSVRLGGNSVPGIRSRSVSSRLILDPGATLTMAGLIQNDKEWTRVGVPGLMHVPILKYLFSRKAMINRKTSIIVFITPTLLEAGIDTPQAAVSPAASKDALLEALDEIESSGENHG